MAPTSPSEVEREYIQYTNVLRTRFRTDGGVLEVTDALLVERDPHAEDAVGVRPTQQLLRRVTCTEGSVEVCVDLEPRFDYGTTSVHVSLRDEHTATVTGGADALVVHCEVALEHHDWRSASGTVSLDEGETRYLLLSYQRPHALDVRPFDRDEAQERLDRTIAFWQDWASKCTYEGPYRNQVLRSALVLKALTDASTGAIVAAPTTSLPEEIGGERNWDYRFTWIRDAATMLNALFGLGFENEAHAFMGWLARTTAGTADDLQVMYSPTGDRMLMEKDLELEGYKGSRPVRVGNQAASQFQLDVYGELVNTAWHYVNHGAELSEELRHLLASVLDQLEDRWQDPDRGLWEVRGAPRQFASSKLFAWVAADRLGRLAEDGRIDVDADRCRRLADRIRADIERYGIDIDTGAILRVYGTPGVDASNLLFALRGFYEPHHRHITATMDAVQRELAEGKHGELVHRYRGEDGVSGQQSAFFWASFWQVSLHVARDERDRAAELMDALVGYANDLGLLSEECHPDTGHLLGNMPQAISHAGLIEAALALAGDQPPGMATSA